MLKLDAATKSLQLVLAGAVALVEVPWVASYVEADQATMGLTAFASADGLTASATPVTLIAAPAAGRTRKLDYLSVVNLDSAAIVVTIRVNIGGTMRPVLVATLAVGDNLCFTDASGWRVISTLGVTK